MSWLRKKAESIAEEWCEDDENAKALAVTIESIAREFAERALGTTHGYTDVPAERHWLYIQGAINEADRE